LKVTPRQSSQNRYAISN